MSCGDTAPSSLILLDPNRRGEVQPFCPVLHHLLHVRHTVFEGIVDEQARLSHEGASIGRTFTASYTAQQTSITTGSTPTIIGHTSDPRERTL